MTHALANELENKGRVWVRNAMSEEDLSLFEHAVTTSARPGQRLEMSDGLITALSPESALLRAVRRGLPGAAPVRIVAFNKSETANWGVPWHQDRIIAVAEKADLAGYRNWTCKSGTWHCEPPKPVLDEMVFVRIHLDDNDRSNGAMEIAVGSHKSGFVPSAQAEDVANTFPIETCTAKRGDVLILKMLTLHASKPAQVNAGRRVFRIDFSPSQLPPPLSWAGKFADT